MQKEAEHQSVSAGILCMANAWASVLARSRALQQCLSSSHTEECTSDHRLEVTQGLWLPLATGRPLRLSVHAHP